MSALGGTTLSGGIADSQELLNQALGASPVFTTDSIVQFGQAYRASGGGPMLAFFGFNPFQIIATGAFHQLYWSAVVIALGITTVVAMQQSLMGKQTLRARHPLAAVIQVYFRLLVGVLIIANTPLIYALLMTLNSALSQSLEAMGSEAAARLFQTGSIGTLSLAQARMDAIHGAAARRAVALYPADASREEMVQIGAWYEATAAAINAALAAHSLPGALPALKPSWNDAQIPDDRLAAYVGRTVLQNFGPMIADLGALPAQGEALAIAFPMAGSSTLPLLSRALAEDDAEAANILALPATPANNAAFEAARQLYAKKVLSDTLGYLDTDLLGMIGASPTLADRAKAWFSAKVEQAAAEAGGFMVQMRGAVDWIGRSAGVVLTRMVAFFFTAGVKVLIEVELFALVLTVPLWLMPATESAFYGVLRSLISLSLAVPAYQFIMLLVDALMGLVLKYILFGPLATDSGGALAGAAGAAYMAAAAIAAVGSGGEIVALVVFCYLVAYLFLAIYAALKTPRLVAVFLKGAGAAGEFLSTFATGLVAGAASAFATTAVAGGSMAGQLLAAGARGGVAGSGVAAANAVLPRRAAASAGQVRPPLGRLVAQALAADGLPSEPSSAFGAVARFGLGTFVSGLQADSPAEALKITSRALEQHRKQQEKDTKEQHRASSQAEKAEKAAAKPRRR